MDTKMIKTTVMVVGLIASAVSGAWVVDSRYAQEQELEVVASNLQTLNKSYQLDKIENRIYDLRKRLWQITDRYKDKQMPQTIREEVAGISSEIEHLMRKMKRLQF